MTKKFKLSPKMMNITKEKFGLLTAISPSHQDGDKVYWNFKCECGRIEQRLPATLRFSKVPGCTSPECTSRPKAERARREATKKFNIKELKMALRKVHNLQKANKKLRSERDQWQLWAEGNHPVASELRKANDELREHAAKSEEKLKQAIAIINQLRGTP